MEWSSVRLSLQVSISSTLLAILIGIPLAYLLARYRFRGYRLVNSLVLIPMLLPPTVLGYYLLQLFGPYSIVGEFLDALFNYSPVFHWSGATLAAFLVSTPFLIRSSQAGFESVERSMEVVAKAHGVGPLWIFFNITTPLAWPSIAAGIAMAFARGIGEFGATIMVAGNIPGKTRTMPIAIYDAVQAGRLEDAHIAAITLSFISIGILILVSTLIAKGR